MATHSSILAWEIPWTEEPGGYSPWGLKSRTVAESQSTPEQRGIAGWQQDSPGFSNRRPLVCTRCVLCEIQKTCH